MRKLLLATVALAALSLPAQAAFISDLGIDPNTGLNRSVPIGAFDDQYTFDLVGAPQFITITSITNVFAGGQTAGRFIQNFTGSVVNDPDGIIGNGDDNTVIGPVAATLGCGIVVNCQSLAGEAVLNAGHYYLNLTGIGIANVSTGLINASYGGDFTTFAVPGPAVGALLPSMFAAFGMLGFSAWRRRRAH